AGWDGAAADAALADAGRQQGAVTTLVDAAGEVAGALTDAQAAVDTARAHLQQLIDSTTALVDQAVAAAPLVGVGSPVSLDAVRLRVAGAVAAAEGEATGVLATARAALAAAAARISGAPTLDPGALAASPLPLEGAPTPVGTSPAGTGGHPGTGGSGTGGSSPDGPGAGSGSTGTTLPGAGSSGGGSSGGGYSAGGYPGGGSSGGVYSGGGGAGVRTAARTAPPLQPGQGVDVVLPGGRTVQAPNEQAAAAVRAAISQLGVPYVWGGTTPGSGLDCSGLTQYAYAQAGVPLPRLAQEQGIGAPVDPGQLLPGDLAVWDGHVAMVAGDGMFVEAGDPVQLSPIRTDNIGMGFHGFFRPTAGA
ncbi:C40 family peptidase, partial [Rhodococcus aerolatus]